MATTKRRAKFEWLKVGDEVVIDCGSYTRIAKVYDIDADMGMFAVSDGRRDCVYTLATGVGAKHRRRGLGKVIGLATPELVQQFAERDEMRELVCYFTDTWKIKPWGKLSLAQLRRIKSELDAAKEVVT